MIDTADRAIAIVGLEAVMPGARDGAAFWQNIKNKVYSISEVHPDRWDPALYYDADIAAPDKCYTKLGGWVRDFEWEPMKWRLPIPPKVSEQLDDGQKWSVALSRGALMQAGWPKWNVDDERVAVILGNAIGGEKHYSTSMRIQFPEFARELRNAPSFQAVPENIREQIIAEAHKSFAALTSGITEDTMPGELANIIAGRVANLFNFRGPNFTTDAACASVVKLGPRKLNRLATRPAMMFASSPGIVSSVMPEVSAANDLCASAMICSRMFSGTAWKLGALRSSRANSGNWIRMLVE